MIILWLLSCFGLTWIITRSVIFAPLRTFLPKPMGTTPFWGTLVRCPQCMGFWVGVAHAVGGFAVLPAPRFDIVPGEIVAAMFSGFVSSGFCYFAMLVCEKLGQEPLDE